MKKFLFIVPLTPSDYCTPLRRELFELFLAALKNQTYKNWQALLIGEEEKMEGSIIYKKIAGKTKEVKLMYAHEYISLLPEKADYIIRLDDDDLISPDVLERVSAFTVDFDCYADKYHCYYDIVSGKVCKVINPWFPNTIIHKTEHALAKFSADKIPLFLLDHSKYWMEYYLGKKIIFEDKNTPVYLRIMSPTSSTSQMHSLKLNEFSDERLQEYWKNIEKIGYWKYQDVNTFNHAINELKSIWKRITDDEVHIPVNRTVSNLINELSRIIRNLSH